MDNFRGHVYHEYSNSYLTKYLSIRIPFIPFFCGEISNTRVARAILLE